MLLNAHFVHNNANKCLYVNLKHVWKIVLSGYGLNERKFRNF